MANFVLAEPWDAGSFSEVGTTAAGLGASNMVDPRVRNVTRLTSLPNAHFTYSTVGRPSLYTPRLMWLGYTNMTPYRNQVCDPRFTGTYTPTWSETNMTKGFSVNQAPGIQYEADLAGSALYYVSQSVPVPFSGWADAASVYLGNGEGSSLSETICASLIVGPTAPSYWIRLGVYDGSTLLLGVDWDGSNALTSLGVTNDVGVEEVNVEGYSRQRIYASKTLTSEPSSLSVRISLLDTNRSAAASDHGGETTGDIDGPMFEYGTSTPSDFVDNKDFRGPIVRVGWDGTTGAWGTASNYTSMVTVHGCQTPIQDPSSDLDIHALAVLPEGIPTDAYVRVMIDDPDNAQGYINVGRLVVADPVQPSLNAEWGIAGPYVTEPVRRSLRRPLRGDRLRTMSLTHTGDEKSAQELMALHERVGTSGQILFSKDPSGEFVWRDTILGQVQAYSTSHIEYDWVRTSFTVTEEYETRVVV